MTPPLPVAATKVMAARSELVDTGGGTLFFIAALAGAGYALYLVWRHYRAYG